MNTIVFFNKTHSSSEVKRLRFFNFVDSGKKISQLNTQRKGENSAWFGLTQFSDMSTAEFKIMNGFRVSTPINMTSKSDESIAIPQRGVDWVKAGKTTSVKNQGQCGSCWTFSAAETVESANLMSGKGGGQRHGSEQEIVDCCKADGSNGCGGGDPRGAIYWVMQNRGLELNSCYGYTATNGPCRMHQCRPAYTVDAVYPIPQDETQIFHALMSHGPLSIAVDAEVWQHYGGGILNANSGCGRQLDHAVQLVGYSPTHGGYWMVRNSWGAGWGEGGYILLAFGGDICGMASYVTGAHAN